MHPWGESKRPHWDLDAYCPDGLLLLSAVLSADGSIADFSFVKVSATAQRILAGTAEPLRGKRLGEALSWGRESGFFDACARVTCHGSPDVVELSRSSTLGRSWMRARISPHRDGLVVFVEDLTERFNAEEALRRDRSLLQAVIESTTDAIFVKDLSGRYTLVNAAAAFALGRAPEGILGRTDDELWDPPQAAAAIAHDRAVFASGRTATYEDSEAGPSAGRVWQTTKGVLRNPGGAPYALFGISRDITARRRTEQLVRESEERYGLVARATNDVIWDWDLVSNEVRWNQALESVLGYPPKEAGRAPFRWWLDCVHPDDRERVFEALDSVGHVGDSWAHEFRCRRVDGSYATVLERGYVARDAEGRPVRLLGSLMDVTERKRQEEEREQEALFRERFIGVLGHDLGNPLAAIRLSTSNLLRRQNLPGDLRRSLQRIDASAERMTRLVGQLLDFSRARMAGGIPIFRRAVEMQEICEHVISELEVAYPERRIVLEVRGTTAGLWDGERLGQVLSNLIANALEHSPPETDVVVTLLDEGETQRAEVHNGGAPIPEALRAHIFEPFRGSKRSQPGAARQAGLGLGLYIVREVVVGHGGQVEVHSTLEEGTRFILTLPRGLAAATEGNEDLEPPPMRRTVARTPPPVELSAR